MLSSEAVFLLILSLTGNTCCLDHSFKKRDNITNLVRELLRRYKDVSEPFLPPRNENLDPVEVSLQWYPTNILLFNERDQFIEFSGVLTVEWHDPVLQWGFNDTGIRSVAFPLGKIWQPQLALQESRTDEYTSIFYENELASVYHNGTVSWTSPVKTSTFCRFFDTRFPFDQQACKLTFFSSVSYQPGIKFNFLNSSKGNATVGNGAWKVGSFTVANCSGIGKFQFGTAIRFVVGLESQRRQKYYMVTLVIPCVILSVFTPFVLFIPGETDLKVPLLTFHITNLFAYQSLVDSIGPPTGNSLISMFVLLNMNETAMVILLSIVSTRLYHKKALLPGWLYRTLRTEKKNTPSKKSELPQLTASLESQQDLLITPENDDLQTSDPGENTPLLEEREKIWRESSLSKTESNNNEKDLHRENIDVEKFDCTAGFIIIIIKCVCYIVFILLYRLSRYNLSEAIQCSEDNSD